MDAIELGQAPVIKRLVELPSGNRAEAIYFNRPEKQVICISSQLSCAVGCIFCASPDAGRTVNLTKEDMISQIEEMKSYAVDDKIMLISFMGEGEPLQNMNNVKATIKHLIANYKGKFKISLSTSGVKPIAIRHLADFYNEFCTDIDFKFQLSLHASNDETRKHIMPLAKSIKYTMDAVDYYRENTDSAIDLNYVLIDNLNDSVANAHELCDIVGNTYHVKISKYNEVPWIDDLKESKNKDSFLAILNERNVSYEYHMTDGEKNEAACGQTRGKRQETATSNG